MLPSTPIRVTRRAARFNDEEHVVSNRYAVRTIQTTRDFARRMKSLTAIDQLKNAAATLLAHEQASTVISPVSGSRDASAGDTTLAK